MTLELAFYSDFYHTNLVIWIPFSTDFGLSSYPFCHSHTIFKHFLPFVNPILLFQFHFQPIWGFHHTHFVNKVPFPTFFGLSSHPIRHSDTILNSFWPFITPTLSISYFSTNCTVTTFNLFGAQTIPLLSFTYHFQTILRFRFIHFAIHIPLPSRFVLS